MTIQIQLTAPEAANLNKAIVGSGGFQSLLRSLKKNFDENTNILMLTDSQIERIQRYTSKYGWGGFEVRLEGVRRNLPNLFV